MNAPTRAAAVLVRAEERLRAEGLTGARAFEALVGALRARLGDDVVAQPVAAGLVAELPVDGVDLLGLAYERFFADLFKGRRGQYFTPRPLVELLLARAGVGAGDVVLDPTCGSGGFLVCAARRGARVRGIERDPLLADLAALNLRLAGFPADILTADFFATDPEPVDVVVANPPFSVVIDDRAVLDRHETGRGRARVLSDALFVEALARWVKPGGRAAIVLPSSILVNGSAEPLRDRLDADFVRVEACGLPEGVFRPFGGAAGRACLLWLRRRPAQRATARWADLADPGWDVRLQRFRATSTSAIEALGRGEGWADLPEGAWTPPAPGLDGDHPRVADLAEVIEERVVPSRTPEAPFVAIDLADADRATGETRGTLVRGAEISGPRARMAPDDVLVARLRPELGNVALARSPEAAVGALVGSPEWIVLRPRRHGHFLLHALRTPTWRAGLPVTGGQTRPRTSPEHVVAAGVPWPGEELASRIDSLSAELHEERARLRTRLDGVQAAVDRFASGELDAAGLAAEIDRLSVGSVAP